TAARFPYAIALLSSVAAGRGPLRRRAQANVGAGRGAWSATAPRRPLSSADDSEVRELVGDFLEGLREVASGGVPEQLGGFRRVRRVPAEAGIGGAVLE